MTSKATKDHIKKLNDEAKKIVRPEMPQELWDKIQNDSAKGSDRTITDSEPAKKSVK